MSSTQHGTSTPATPADGEAAAASVALPVAPARSFRLTPAQRISLLVATVALIAATLFVTVVRNLPAADTAVALPWFFWAAAFAAVRGAGRPRPVAARGAHVLHR